ncbi:MAG: DUF6178 family protein [Desulfobacterales bacterium]|jgi:hypothetical protein
MNDNAIDKKALERFQQLLKTRKEILELPPETAMERILEHPQPAALVHSFPEQDFYFLINDIGPEDSLPLLALASDRQWEHIVDLDAWQRDRIELTSVTRWMNLLMEADSKRFIRWFLDKKLDFIEFYLFKNIEVRVREHDQDPTEFGEDFFSLDGTYYFRIIEFPPENESDKMADERRKRLINRLVEQIAAFDHSTLQHVLLEATHVLPAETEEECFRWRNVRLAEKGFLPFDEAVGIYQSIKPEELKKESTKVLPSPADEPAMAPVPLYHWRMLKEENYFTRALTKIESQNVLQQIEVEFANLCNQIIVADNKSVRAREDLADIVKKVCGYLSIGLERLSKDSEVVDVQKAAALITKYPLHRLFKVGFGGAMDLKWRAEKWLTNCWFAGAGLRLTFWGERWLGVLGGLLIKKPMFYDNYKTGVLYREFASFEDIKITEDIFKQVKAVDDLLSLMTIHLDHPSSYGFLTYKNLILTLWAKNYLKLQEKKLMPLVLREFQPFFKNLLPCQPGTEADQPRSIPIAMKNHFIEWLAADTGLKDFEITQQLGNTFNALFNELESELGRVAVEDLDPRYVQLFLLRKKN